MLSKNGLSRAVRVLIAAMTIGLGLTGCMKNKESRGEGTETEETDAPAETAESAADQTHQPFLDEAFEPLEEGQAEAVRAGQDLPVSRAQAAKALALAYYDTRNINTLEREAPFDDTNPGMWYDKYVNAVYLAGIMTGDGQSFMPDQPLTIQQAEYLLNAINPVGLELAPTEDLKAQPIAYALWTESFVQAFKGAAGGDMAGYFGLKELSAVPLQTDGQTIITDVGAFTCADVSFEPYIDKRCTLLIKDGEIAAVLTVDGSAPVIRNAYISSASQDSVTIFSGGAERTYAFSGEARPGDICDIMIQDGTALALTPYADTATGTVKRLTEEYTELADVGVLTNDPALKVYDITDGTPRWKGLSSVIIGSAAADFTVSAGVVKAITIKRAAGLENIRALISATDFSGYTHEAVSITGAAPFTVRIGDSVSEYAAGDTFVVTEGQNADIFGPPELITTPRIYVTSTEPDGKLRLNSVAKNWPDGAAPEYRGTLEIAVEPDGSYTVVNEVGFEEYLYAVVPSEMPSGHGAEAAKVQAVTARSYAYNQYYENAYFRYGANVDDSVMCQVYNNIPENPVSIAACDETRGLCLTYGGNVISANFFSTSAGVTANSGEVWPASATMEFPAVTTEYLKSTPQYVGADYGDLSVEQNAAAFFKDLSVQSYDSGFGWFRWNVAMSAEELSASVNAALAERYAANPLMIKTLQPNGVYRSRPITGIGWLMDMEVAARGAGGNIMAMKLTGSEATVMVYTELNVRYLLRPAGILYGGYNITVNRHIGEGVSNFSMMPSAFFTFDKQYDESGVFTDAAFYGGGYGHGVGMSQNGVKGMIDAGFTFEDILSHYYNGIDLTKKW